MKSVDTELEEELRTHTMEQEFDAVVVVTGAMAKPNIPHLPGK